MALVLTPDSPILGPATGALAQADAYGATKGGLDIPAYTQPLWSWCAAEGIDPLVAFAQFCVETDVGRSSRWRANRNPAGLAVVADGDPDPGAWTAEQAAAVHVACLLVALRRSAKSATLQAVVNAAPGAATFLERWRAKYRNPACPEVRRVGDLCLHYGPASNPQATWAWDPTYGMQIAAHATKILAMPGGQPVPTTDPALNMTRGLIPFPSFIDRLVPDSQNTAWDSLGQRSIERFILHRMLGGLDGTDGYFRTMGGARARFLATGEANGALTDFGIDAATGRLYRWNDPSGAAHALPGGLVVSANRSPWASGPFNTQGDAYGDGLAFAQKYGANAVNRLGLSWEISGDQTDPFADPAMKVTAQAIAATAHDKGIRWHDFPMVVADGASFVIWHEEITGPSVKRCPFEVVKAQTNALIAMAKEIMRLAQTAGVPNAPKYTQPKVPKEWATHNALVFPTDLSNGWIAMRRKWTTAKAVKQGAVASPKSAEAGPTVPAKVEIFGEYLAKAADGQWYVVCRTNNYVAEGARIPLSALVLPKGFALA